MEKTELLAGSEIFDYLVSQGSKDIDHVAEAAADLAEAKVSAEDVRNSMRFAACLVGFYREVFPIPEQNGLYILFSAERKKSAIAGYLSGEADGYLIFANGLTNEIGARLRQMLDYDQIMTEEALMVGMAARHIRYHLLRKGRVKPIKRDDHLRTKDPLLKETIKLYGEELRRSGNQLAEIMDGERLDMEFDTMVIETAALRRLEWGMSLKELVALVKTEIRPQSR